MKLRLTRDDFCPDARCRGRAAPDRPRELEARRPRAPQLLSRLPEDNYSAEIQRTTVETNTDVVDSLAELRRGAASGCASGLVEVAAPEGLGIAAVGTAPRSAFADFELTTTGRYGRMQEQYRLLVDEQLICGMQIHVGVSDRDLAVQIMQRIARDLPILLALSASSPFWNGQDTGYASIRTIIWQRWPTAGATGRLALGRRVRRADRRPDQLRRHRRRQDGLLRRPALRARAHPGAARLRRLPAGRRRDPDRRAVPRPWCGPPSTSIEAGRAVRARARRRCTAPRSGGRPAAGWPASCSTTAATPSRCPPPRRSGDLVGRLRPQLEELGDWDEVSELAETALARGNSADRQRAAFAERGRLDDVVRARGRRDPRARPAGRRRPCRRCATTAAGPATRPSGPGHRPRPAYGDLVDCFRALAPDELATARAGPATRGSTRHGLTFGVERREAARSRSTWCRGCSARTSGQSLSAGLIQRARAIESFLPRRLRRRSGSWPTACCAAERGRAVARAGAPRPPGCRPAPCGRRSWASTWSATSTAAGGCWRTTSATPAGPRTRSPSAS